MKQQKLTTVLLLSYYSNQDSVTSEWTKDKIDSLVENGARVHLVTSARWSQNSSPHLSVWTVGSLSRNDRLREQALNYSNTGNGDWFRAVIDLFLFPLGWLFDRIFLLIAGSQSDGKWSWGISASIVSFIMAVILRPTHIVCTGGPSSAFIPGIFLGRILRMNVFYELQDPLIPKTLDLNNRVMKIFDYLELSMLKSCNKLVLVSKNAAEEMKHKYPKYHDRIYSIYPGAPKFPLSQVAVRDKNVCRITYIGTLYGTRNMGTLLRVIDEGRLRGYSNFDKIRITIIGRDKSDLENNSTNHPIVTQMGRLERLEALATGMRSDFLLLVQHSDSRSQTTIPYKLYDYLQLGLPVLSLSLNEEIEPLVLQSGGACSDPSDSEQIKNLLVNALDRWANHDAMMLETPSYAIDSVVQVREMLDLG